MVRPTLFFNRGATLSGIACFFCREAFPEYDKLEDLLEQKNMPGPVRGRQRQYLIHRPKVLAFYCFIVLMPYDNEK